jgi:metacaspase-1
MKKLVVCILLAALLSLVMFPSAVLAKSDRPGQVSATDVEIVKKVTLKGPASRGGKPAPTAATGTLGAPVTGTKYAVVVGIEDYPGTANDLQYTVDDADEMSSVLKTKYGFPAGNVTELTNTGATKTTIYNAITSLIDITGENDEVVFFFSGHGAKGRAADGDRNNTDQAIVVQEAGSFAYIWDGELVSWFSGFNSGTRIVFIFDSCLSGGMAVLQGPNRIVNMACTATGLSYEGATWGGGHGQFTYYFAEEGMEKALADVKLPNGKVTVEEAFDYAKANCQSQTPTIADGFSNDLLP